MIDAMIINFQAPELILWSLAITQFYLMPCLYFDSGDVRGFLCGFHKSYKLRLLDGRRVFMEWHRYCGPTFYFDRYLHREIDDWFKDPLLCRAVEWFQGRGEKA